MPERNIELLKKVRAAIVAEPKRLDMGEWGANTGVKVGDLSEDSREDYLKDYPACGTKACLAGWTIFLGDGGPEPADWAKLLEKYGTKDMRGLCYGLAIEEQESVLIEWGPPWRAAKLLGMTREECPFFATEWSMEQVLGWLDLAISGAAIPELQRSEVWG